MNALRHELDLERQVENECTSSSSRTRGAVSTSEAHLPWQVEAGARLRLAKVATANNSHYLPEHQLRRCASAFDGQAPTPAQKRSRTGSFLDHLREAVRLNALLRHLRGHGAP